MTSRWAPWGALLRRARRLAWRSPLRTAWTALLVAAAVAVGAAALSVLWGHHLAVGSVDGAFGSADVVYDGSVSPATEVPRVAEAVRSALPTGSRLQVEETVTGLVLTGDHRGGSGSVHMADWNDPLLHGVIGLLQGRVPRRGEAVLSPALAEATDLRIGGRIRLTGSERTLVVVGIGTIGAIGNGSPRAAAVAPGELVPVSSASPSPEATVRAYVGLPAGGVAPPASSIGMDGPGVEGSAITGAAIPGVAVQGPYGRNDPGGIAPDGTTLVGHSAAPLGTMTLALGLVVAFVALLAGATVGIGARRRMRANGLLAVNGAGDGQLAMAAASEAIVVALPATILGVVAAVLGRLMWVRLRLPGWAAAVDAAFDWPWILPLVAVAVAAAGLGAVIVSRPSRRMAAAALLDGRDRVTRPAGGSPRIGWVGWLLLGALAWVVLGGALAGTMGWFVGSASLGGAVVLLVLWLACGFGALRLTRLVLARDPIGRVVDRDLRHRWLGSTATIVVVATWVFVAVAGTATAGFGTSDYVNASASSLVEPAPSTSETASPVAVPTTTLLVTAPPVPGTPSTALAPTRPPAPLVPGSSVLVQAMPEPSSNGSGAPTAWVLRGSEPTPAKPTAPTRLPDGLAAELAGAGLTTSSGVVGEWTGPCPACPSGFTPTVLVLQRAEGVGLAPATVDLLNAGNAVTPFDIAGIENQTVAGVPVRVGSVPSGANAVLLASSASEDLRLADPRPALIGPAAGLSDTQASRIIDIAEQKGLAIGFDDPRFDQLRSTKDSGATVLGGRHVWIVWPWLVVLLVVTLAATAAHRREHGEAARVLRVLGASPRLARRLASLTAATLTGVGVALGLTAAFLLLAVAVTRMRPGSDGPWNRSATLVLVVSLALPVVVALLARLIPPYRSLDGPDAQMPA
ncbi:MAG: hypothetical protein JST64_06795 [Actinobacteria bacterium]|nr:hypothetical protein [Actinomycetota bacterium]